MENSEVLNQPKDGPIQKDVAPIQDAPVVINQDTSNTYAQAKAPTAIVGEKDHASEIAQNSLGQEEADKTYNYNSQAGKEYDKSIHTTTTQSTGASLSGTFKDKYEMGEGYKATDDSDYSWNKLAQDMAQTKYDQEAAQARFQSIQAKQQIDAAASKAWDNYFAAEYSSKQTQDKMGWTGGQEQASDLQVQFLQAETATNMYTQDEMHKYGVETKLGTARMYADAEQKTLALKYYQDAVDVAIREGELTGYYVPPEASEMFDQQKIADKIINDPTSTEAAKARARQVNEACNKYYESLGFERGYRYDKETGKVVTELYGIKVLSQLTYEETVRNNKVNEELQKQANDIAREGNTIAGKGNELAELQLKETISLTNQQEINYNSQEINNISKGHKVISKSKTNYFVDNEGKTYDVPAGSPMYKYNHKYYYRAKVDGLDKMWEVHNSDKAYATDHANKRKDVDNNYRPR